MDVTTMQSFKDRLIAEKERLSKELDDVDSSMDESQSEWTGENQYENHMADLGTDTIMRESDLSISNNIRDILNRVNDALQRIDDNTYGFCRVCGRAIEIERLEALPYADLCIEDKKKVEKSW